MQNNLFLRDIDKQRLLKLLADYLPEVNAWAYGSRVNGGAHDTSDLNVVLRVRDLSKIPLAQFNAFLQTISDSNIPILVEARDWARLPESFHQEVLRNYVELTD